LLDKNNCKELIKNVITNADDGSEDSMWVEHETVNAEGESSSENDNT
jgi:hypothetical protein